MIALRDEMILRDAMMRRAQLMAENSRETDAERETRLRRSPQSWVCPYDVGVLLELLDKARATVVELEGMLQYAGAVGAAAVSALDKAGLSVPTSIDVDAWLAARAELQFRQRAASNNWIKRLHGEYTPSL